MKETTQTVWLEMYQRCRRQVRWLSSAILVLGLTAVFDGQANYDRLAEEYQSAVDMVLTEQKHREFRGEIKSVFKEKKTDRAYEWDKMPDAIIVELRAIRPLHRKYVRSRAAQEEQEAFKIGNQSLGIAAYTTALRYGPIIVFFAMIWPLLSIRKLHRYLAVAAKSESVVQAKLNSLFFDRITERYGQSWRRHVFFSLGLMLVVAMSTPLIFASTRSLVQADLRVAINAEGKIFPINDDPLTPRILMDIHSPLLEKALGELIIVELLTLSVFAILLVAGLACMQKSKK